MKLILYAYITADVLQRQSKEVEYILKNKKGDAFWPMSLS